ncbi:MAG: amino acid adenylation domain-containing protein, partial [Acidobacteriota bacterium]
AGGRRQEESVVSSERESGSASEPYSLQPTAYSLLPPLPIQYSDYAAWQRNWLSGEVLERQLGYWKQLLQGAPVLQLPSDRPRPAQHSHRGALEPFRWPRGLRDALGQVCQAENATLFMTLLAAFQVLLYRCSGQTDITNGTPIANRNRAETENLIGFFVNTLAMRIRLRKEERFSGLLQRVREMALEAYAHQDVPFEQVVEALQPERSLSHSPLFQVMFAFQNTPGEELRLAGLELSPLLTGTTSSRFDLSLQIGEDEQGLAGSLTYATDLFDPSTAQRMLRHYRRLLEGIGKDPSCPVQELPLMDDNERQELLAHWNPSSRSEVTAGIFACFAEEARKRADGVALMEEGRQGAAHLSYSGLERLSAQTARRLSRCGVGAEALAGIFLQRSVEMVAGLLGILRTGAAYLPLDPAYPRNRLAEMVRDSGIKVVLTQKHLVQQLPPLDLRTVFAETASGQPLSFGQAFAADPDQIAYVMYTSGSMGRPKGVAVTQRGVVRLVRGSNYAQLGPDQVMLQLATISFDASTFQIWGSLLNGARLVIFPPRRPSLQELARFVQRHAITLLGLPAALFRLLAEQRPEALKSLPQLLSGGDVLPPATAQQALQAGLGRLINAYGPTENTTYTCCHVMESVPQESGTVPIGRPIAGTTIYLLDQHLQPVPPGVAGQLFTGGQGLARGYWQRPGWTAQSFVPHPFGPGERLYRTGDLVRWRQGAVEFLGRIDQQVKIRGFRVEPAEVEAALSQHPEVERALVTVEGESGEKRLVAWVQPTDGSESHRFRAFLQGRLPEFMVPSQFVEVDEFALTPGGKIDRRTLSVRSSQLAVRSLESEPGARNLEPGIQRVGSWQLAVGSPEADSASGTYSLQPTAYSLSPSPTQELLAGIWCEVLGIDGVAAQDDFFERGGHSLMAIRVVSRIQQVLGLEVPLRAVFENSKLQAL